MPCRWPWDQPLPMLTGKGDDGERDIGGHEQAEAGEFGKLNEGELLPFAGDVIRDHDLEAEGSMPEGRTQQNEHQAICDGLAQPIADRGVVGPSMDDETNDEPDDEGDEQQGRHALDPPAAHTLPGRAAATDPGEGALCVAHQNAPRYQ